MILNDTVTLGFGHFLAQSDFVSRTLLGILLLMSVVSWALIVSKGISQLLRRARSERFLQMFWNASSLQAVQHEITTHGVRDPFAHLTAHAMHAQVHHARYGSAKLEEAGTAQDFLTRGENIFL